tara:strand:+ start:704 stop:1306 length:603 start_codon:yes stop_codon:yes gene_type:complete
MVKIPNEALLIGGAILAALVLSKGRGSTSIPFINPFSDLLAKTETKAIQKLGSNVDTLESARQSNISISESILGYERGIADIKISRQQTELDKTQQYIGQQQKIPYAGGYAELAPKGDWQNAAQALLGKISRTNQGQSVFPDFKLIANNKNVGIIQQQARYEVAQQNIELANQTVLKQMNEIQRLGDVYEQTYGDISRYS